MKTLHLIIASSVLISFACKKDEKELSAEITTGVVTGMVVQVHDTVIAGLYNQTKYFNVDLNKDGEDDIQLSSVLIGSPGMGAFPETTIRSLHSAVKLLGINSHDTTFRNLEITWYHDPQFNKYWKTFNYTYSCNRMSSEDSIVKITPVFKLKPLESGVKISISDDFSSNSFILRRGNRIPDPPKQIGANGDTIYYERNIHLYDCNLFPIDQKLYIGFVLNDERLGWISITHASYVSITVHESAIQNK